MGQKHLFSLLLFRLFSAFKGYIVWHNVIHRYKVLSDCAVILIPSPTNEEYALYSVKYLKAFLKCNCRFQRVIFLSNYPKLAELLEEYQAEECVLASVLLSEKKITHLLDFYTANLNDERLIIAALDVPYGRMGLNYLHTKVLSKEEIFLIGIYSVTKGPEFERFAHTVSGT